MIASVKTLARVACSTVPEKDRSLQKSPRSAVFSPASGKSLVATKPSLRSDTTKRLISRTLSPPLVWLAPVDAVPNPIQEKGVRSRRNFRMPATE